MRFDHYYVVSTDDRARFESVYLDQAEAHARLIWQAEKVIAAIGEVMRREAREARQ